jgi:predicted TPR repeat methyltransferase
VKVAKEIVGAVVRAVPLSADMDVLDFGCGTGLVGMSIRPHVRSLTCVDNSSGMLEELRKKVAVAGVGNVNQRLSTVSGRSFAG